MLPAKNQLQNKVRKRKSKTHLDLKESIKLPRKALTRNTTQETQEL